MPSRSSLLFLFREGYSLVALPLALFNLATTTYYLLIVNIPFLSGVFPSFWVYLVTGAVLGVPSILLLGTVYIRSSLFKAPAKNNPYSYIVTPNLIPLYQAVSSLCEIQELVFEAEELEKIIKASREESSIHA